MPDEKEKYIYREKLHAIFTEGQLVDLHPAAKTSWHQVTASPTKGKKVFSNAVFLHSSLSTSFTVPAPPHPFQPHPLNGTITAAASWTLMQTVSHKWLMCDFSPLKKHHFNI